MIEHTAVIVRNPRVEYRKLADGGGAVLLNLDTAAYHGLNQTGSVIWETVGDGMQLDQVVPQVAALFDDAPPTLAQEVTIFIEDLVERDLLRVDDAHSMPASNAPGGTEPGGTEKGAG
jgi:Coenzyme PQQ synthesis protein D (PqqD)